MATNLPQNDTYGAAASAYVPKKIKYTPNTLYKNLGQLKQRYETGATPISDPNQDKQAAVFKYGNSLFNYGTEEAPDFRQGIPTGRPFLPEGDLRTPIPIDRATYGQFQPPASYTQNGEDISWGTPVSPVIRNIKGSGITGQYVEDTTDPEKLVKTIRPDEGKASLSDKAILAGRPGWMYQIDHIVPLNLGGADTLANRQLLSQGENDKKTRAQAVAYTLYAHINPETGKRYLSLSEARNMAMQWKNQDVTDIPQPNTIGFVSDQEPKGILGMLPGAKGKTGLQIALEAQKKWSQPKVPTVKDVLAGIPEAARDFGKGWLPDPLREFIKGAESAATLGFIPYEQGEDQDMGSKVGGILGRIVGTFAPWAAINAAVKVPYYFLGARKVFATALADKFLSTAGKETLTAAAKTRVGMDLKSLPAARDALYAEHLAKGGTLLGKPALTEAEMLAQAAAKAKETGINKIPGYFSKLFRDPRTVETATQFAITNAIFSQATQYVGNHLSPQVLSGQAFEQDEKNILGNILKDLSLGALFGMQSRTLKGTAYATMLPVTIGLWSNPDDPVDAIVSGAVFGALHAHSVLAVPQKGFLTLPKFKIPEGYNDVEMLGGKAYNDPMLKAQAHIVDHTAHAQASAYTDIIPREIDITKPVPKYTEEQLNQARNDSRDNIIRLLFGEARKRSPTQRKQVSELKTLPEKINKELDTLETPAPEKGKPSSFGTIAKYFTPSGREELKAKSKENKAAVEKIRTMFGEGWKTRLGEIGETPVAAETKATERVPLIPNKIQGEPVVEKPVVETAPEPQEGILSFEAARAEIARITVAYRHLYKLTLPHEGDPNIRGIVKEFRGKADLDDLLSVTKRHMGENSKTILDLLQRPEAAGRVTEILLKAEDPRISGTFKTGFMDQKLPSTGDFKDKSFVTGPGLDVLTPQTKAFIEELLKYENGRYMGDASPTLIGVIRKELAPLLRQKNGSLDPAKLASGESGIDPHPENAIQVFGVRKDSNGEAYLVELGFIASNHRLNTGRDAMNKNADKYELPKVGLNKDQIAEIANKENLQVMLLNSDPIKKAEGPMSGKPYLFINISPETIRASHAVQNVMFEQGYKNPFVVDAAKASQAISEVQTKGMEAVTKSKEVMKNNPERKDASEYIPSYPPETTAAPLAEITKQVFQRSKEALNVESPAQLQENFQKSFGITLKETEAQELWNRRNDITLEEMGTRLLRAVDNKKTDVKTAIDVEMMRDYVRSGALEYAPEGKAILSMPVIGYGETPVARAVETPVEAVAKSINETRTKYTGVEDQPYPGPLGLKPPTAETNAVRVTEPTTTKGINIRTDKTSPNSLANRLTNPNWYANGLFNVESAYKAQKSKNPNKEEALKEDMNTMYLLQLKKFRQNPELIDEINGEGGLNFIYNSEHTVGVKNSRWEGKGLDSNFIKVLARSYETVSKELNKFIPASEPSSISNIATKREPVITQEAGTQPAGISFEKNLMTGFARESAPIVDKTTNPTRIQELVAPSKKGFSMIVGGKTYTFQPEESTYKRVDQSTGKVYKLNPDNTESLSTPPRKSTVGAGSFEGKVEPMSEEVQRLLADVNPTGSGTGKYVGDEVSASRKNARKVPYVETTLESSQKAMREMGLIPSQEFIPTPKLVANEFFKGIDEGIKSKEPAAQYWNKAIDKGLKDILGPSYRNDPKVAEALDKYFGGEGEFFNFMNKEGREIQQTPAIAKALASGDRKAYYEALEARRKEIAANKAGTGGNMSEQELRTLGIEPGEGDFAGMSVRPVHQEGLVSDLSRGENLMIPIFGGEGPVTGKQSVLAARTLFLGQGKTGEGGLKSFLLARFPTAKKSISFDQLEKEAIAADATYALKEKMKSNKFVKAKDLLASLKKQKESIEKVIAPPEERPKWQTKDVVEAMEKDLKDIQERIEKGEKYIKETGDGAGGPGYHDGRGGPGDAFGSFKGAMKNLWNGGNVLGGLTGTTVYNKPSPATKPTYTVRGVTVDDDDLSEISRILLGEVSNRTSTSSGDKRPFEVRHIVNTGINRVLANRPKEFGSTLREVFQYPGAYQAYAPHGTTVSGGKVVKNDYQRALAGELDYPTQQKLKIIQDTLNEIKSGKFEDTTSGSKFYVHASDGSLWLGATGAEAKQNANRHERKSGIRVTPWGTAVGLPAVSPLAYKNLGK